eukprot:CAMPEP_0185166214 /NCGR_PEP_ID=MMETSP1139-20130426/12184_1 /TAXON_ID=298111 /ORGANISM="Pavlova sp., Strain CCMP459" /LENGTH=32 /DNA_ID= /DNA_START= /DNA_END= /DNA_ORIENTATION=
MSVGGGAGALEEDTAPKCGKLRADALGDLGAG